MSIGFDFGTTNSIISYYNRESAKLDCYQRNAADQSYIPTVIHYGKREPSIGNAAKQSEGFGETYSRFKLELGSSFDQTFPGRERTRHEVAKDYIRTLLKDYIEKHGKPDKVVMTIPEAWFREQKNMTARENIRTILEEIGQTEEIGLTKEQYQFQSEPVAAAAYFCYRWQTADNPENIERRPYEGDLLIIDYGGGTLDVTLCRADGKNHIKVVNSCGFGGDGSSVGCAGSAFDQEVIRRLCEEQKMTPDEVPRIRALHDFERQLIAQEREVRMVMMDYYYDPEAMKDEELFQLYDLNNTSVTCRHLEEAFEQVNRGVLRKALETMSASEEFHANNTKVVMVGGFSNFVCVEKSIREYYGNKQLDAVDRHFPGLLNDENRALAIAKGAALIAEGEIQVDPTFPYELGLTTITAALLSDEHGNPILNDDGLQEVGPQTSYYPLIKRGETIERFATPVYSSRTFDTTYVARDDKSVRVYIGEGKDRLIIPIAHFYPRGENLKVGISVDKDMVPTLYTKINDNVTTSSLNRIVEMVIVTAPD